MTRAALRCALACLTLLLSHAARAHDARPAYLEIEESAPGVYQLVWRTPVLSGVQLPVALRLPQSMHELRPPARRELSDSVLERRILRSDAGTLAGTRIEFVGLEATITDVLVRVRFADGTQATSLVRGSRPWLEIPASSGALEVAGAYLRHGVEHILFGFDHLLFVLALLLIVRGTRALLWTLTAFTLAHSLTLALATLDVVDVPGPPVEAAIALSILLLASEIVQLRRGRAGLSARRPWLVAFGFGLLHGFGFAGALRDVGLPHADIPLALFAFNLGVECGQLVFVAALLALAALARRVRPAARLARYTAQAAPHLIGVLAAFWLFERLARF